MSFLFYLALVPSLALIAQWLAWRTRLPSILLLLVLGIALGEFIRPDDLLARTSGGDSSSAGPQLLFPFVSLAVAIIMFEGGLSLKLKELGEAGKAVLRLCSIGSLITFVGTTIAAHYCFDFGWKVSCLLGAILIVTGPTVIGPLLRQVRPSTRVANTLKWEGIVSDPIGAVSAVLVFDLLMVHGDEASVAEGLVLLLKTVAIGGIVGSVSGLALSTALKRFLIPDHLHGFAALGSALLIFAGCDQLAHESGLVAVTVFGVWMSNQEDLEIEHIVEFKENLRTVLIGCLFIVLASRVDLGTLAKDAWAGVLFVAALVLIVRPIAVFVSLFSSELNYREQAFIAGLAPRGIVAAAVSSVFSLRLEQLGGFDENGSDQLANVAFMAIIGTVAIYGLIASPLARLLGLSNPDRNGVLIAGADDWVVAFAKELKSCGFRVLLIDTNYSKITKAKLEDLDAVCANILNEHVRDDLDLSGIGNFLAMTPNDQVNSLAVLECRSLFGRSRTYQLTFKTDNKRGMTRNLMGRELFAKGLTHTRIRELVAEGMIFKTTNLSEEFTRDDFASLYPQHHVLAAVSEAGSLVLITTDDGSTPKTARKYIALVRQ